MLVIVNLCLKMLKQYYVRQRGVISMYNNSQSPIMVVSGKKAKEILKKAETPIANHTRAVNKARERLRKLGTIK